jgi:hypothetical protein
MPSVPFAASTCSHYGLCSCARCARARRKSAPPIQFVACHSAALYRERCSERFSQPVSDSSNRQAHCASSRLSLPSASARDLNVRRGRGGLREDKRAWPAAFSEPQQCSHTCITAPRPAETITDVYNYQCSDDEQRAWPAAFSEPQQCSHTCITAPRPAETINAMHNYQCLDDEQRAWPAAFSEPR